MIFSWIIIKIYNLIKNNYKINYNNKLKLKINKFLKYLQMNNNLSAQIVIKLTKNNLIFKFKMFFKQKNKISNNFLTI
jgi:hypothetical protein